MAEGYEAQGLAKQPGELVEVWPALLPPTVPSHLVHQRDAAEGSEDKGHGLVRDLFDEGIGNVGNGNPALGSGLYVDRVGAHAPKGDHLTPLEAFDDRSRSP